ncbi:MAG: phage Gp37/Gp68 family protein [Candidatus Sulfotelmatobacter sp.]
MGKTTGIEWTDCTWNPIRGCSRVSEGCRNCYAESVAARFSGIGRPYNGLATFKIIDKGTPEEHLEARWTGELRFIEDRLQDPIMWKAPKKIFVNSMSDLFHPRVKDEWLVAIFDVMARAPQHTYQILTKRPERMQRFLETGQSLSDQFERTFSQKWPAPNWWFGVSVEDQNTADYRLPILAECAAAVRFVSYEPALGPIDFRKCFREPLETVAIDWLIVGGESGPRARPMDTDWARSAREFCLTMGIPFFFKQYGEYMDHIRVGKKKAGHVLDGVEWREFPKC